MNKIRPILSILLVVFLVTTMFAGDSLAGKKKKAEKQAKIDAQASETMSKLFEKRPK